MPPAAPKSARPGITTPDFPRIRRLPPYVFEEVNRLKARLRGAFRQTLAGYGPTGDQSGQRLY